MQVNTRRKTFYNPLDLRTQNFVSLKAILIRLLITEFSIQKYLSGFELECKEYISK